MNFDIAEKYKFSDNEKHILILDFRRMSEKVVFFSSGGGAKKLFSNFSKSNGKIVILS